MVEQFIDENTEELSAKELIEKATEEISSLCYNASSPAFNEELRKHMNRKIDVNFPLYSHGTEEENDVIQFFSYTLYFKDLRKNRYFGRLYRDMMSLFSVYVEMREAYKKGDEKKVKELYKVFVDLRKRVLKDAEVLSKRMSMAVRKADRSGETPPSLIKSVNESNVQDPSVQNVYKFFKRYI